MLTISCSFISKIGITDPEAGECVDGDDEGVVEIGEHVLVHHHNGAVVLGEQQGEAVGEQQQRDVEDESESCGRADHPAPPLAGLSLLQSTALLCWEAIYFTHTTSCTFRPRGRRTIRFVVLTLVQSHPTS